MENRNDRTLAARSALHAGRRPDHPAVVCEGRTLTYGELHRHSNRTAHALLGTGLGPGARIGYLGQESEHYFDIALGCAKSGTVLVPINWRLTAPEVEHILADAQAEVLFVEREFQDVVERLRPSLPRLRHVVVTDTDEHVAGGLLAWKEPFPDTDLPPVTGFDDAVAQLYTSGTTGLPKGVVLAQRTFFTFIADMTAAGVDWIDWRPDDRGLCCFPALHTAGFGWFMHSFNVGATTVIMRKFIADEATRLIERLRITTVWAAPAMLRMMLTERGTTRDTFRSLRKVVYSGSPIDRDLLLTCIDVLDCELAQGYSSAEAGSFVTCLAPADHRPDSQVLGSAGRICPGNDIQIVDDEGNVLPAGRVGRVRIKSPARFLEYWRLPQATTEAVRGDWLAMGDMGCLDEDGYLFLVDRVNDTIIVAGQNIYPTEVENALRQHPAVEDVAVYGVPDTHWGEAVRAAVVLRPDADAKPRDFLRFMNGRVANFKIPTGYEIVDALPRNPTGKVLRRVLRERHTAGAEQPAGR
ncbi:long-chain-fatty-acid--CoA ligase [Streptomyces spinoverrucosus]|uniref:long-chain-fatty-acid--CoA ligase n=1 Tax=Streptomyces spinoverrucosus TaxID=284043 RepID=UPI0018C4061D|nr:long-chain-fatty-acid--CoA ligase [Streptomyces spinoverrucosus]MBG0851770.1 long-chain-fatty-acid--CoA ligase [Streptomyces spinoverrucosus]